MASKPRARPQNDTEFTLSEQDRDRIIKETGILEKLPPDFIPFDPTSSSPLGKNNPFAASTSQTSVNPASTSSYSASGHNSARSRKRISKPQARQQAKIVSTSNDGKIQEFVEEATDTQTYPDQAQSQWAELISDTESDEDKDEADSEVGSDTSSRFKVKNSIDDPSASHTNAEALYQNSRSDSIPPHIEKLLDLIIWTIPFGFLYVMLDVMIHQQYAQHPTAWEEVRRVAGNIPSECLEGQSNHTILNAVLTASALLLSANNTVFAFFIYHTMPPVPAARARTFNFFFFALATLAGSSFLYVFHTAKFRDVIRQTPPLGILWVYCIVRTDLFYSVVSLSLVGLFIWFMGLPLIGE